MIKLKMHNVEAGKRLFVHRRSKIHLHTRTTIQISSNSEWPDAPLGSFSLQDALLSWFPRSRNLPLLLRASFSEDLDPRLITSKCSLLADHIAETEVSREKDYWIEPDQISCGNSSDTRFRMCNSMVNRLPPPRGSWIWSSP